MHNTDNSNSKTVEIYSSQCIGVTIRSWTYKATVVRENKSSLRVLRAGRTDAETFRFVKVLSTGERYYKKGNEGIRLR